MYLKIKLNWILYGTKYLRIETSALDFSPSNYNDKIWVMMCTYQPLLYYIMLYLCLMANNRNMLITVIVYLYLAPKHLFDNFVYFHVFNTVLKLQHTVVCKKQKVISVKARLVDRVLGNFTSTGAIACKQWRYRKQNKRQFSFESFLLICCD